MINNDRIVLMCRAASLSTEQARELETNNYYRKEYVVSHFLVVWLYVSIVYVLIGAAATALFIEEYPKEAQTADWMLYLVTYIMIYVIVVFVYVLLCLVIYSVRYGKSQQTVKQYNYILKQIDKLYEEEETVVMQVKNDPIPVKKVKKKITENRKGEK